MISSLKSTKEKLLYILKKDHEIPIKDIMDYFTISNVAVRRHLNDLIQEKFVTERSIKQDIGRPYSVYSLTRKGHETFPNQYEQFSIDILKDLEEVGGEVAVQDVLSARKKREAAELQQQLANKNFTEKIAELCAYQDRKGYMHEFEQTPSGDYLVKNYNCPIFSLASNYEVVCSNEKDMYRKVFPNSEVTSHSCMTKGGKFCCWTISNPKQ